MGEFVILVDMVNPLHSETTKLRPKAQVAGGPYPTICIKQSSGNWTYMYAARAIANALAREFILWS